MLVVMVVEVCRSYKCRARRGSLGLPKLPNYSKSNRARSTRWLRRIASPIASRQAQTFCVSISKKFSSGPDEKTDDLKDRCCYHPPRSLGGCNLMENN